YEDVRLVFAPELEIAFFGGLADDFVFPRYALDVALFRVYQNGEAIHPLAFLRVSKAGVREDELVFGAGLPSPTNRRMTAAILKKLSRPYEQSLEAIRTWRQQVSAYAANGVAEEIRVTDHIHGIDNMIKEVESLHSMLEDGSTIADKEEEERELLELASGDPQLAKELIAAVIEINDNPSLLDPY